MQDISQLVLTIQQSNVIWTQILAVLKQISPVAETGSGPQAAQSITGNGQTIAVGNNGSVVLTSTTGGNLTGMILEAGTVAGQHFTIMNTPNFTLTFAAAGTSHVFGTPTQAAQSAQTYFWDGTNSLWRAT